MDHKPLYTPAPGALHKPSCTCPACEAQWARLHPSPARPALTSQNVTAWPAWTVPATETLVMS